MACWLSQQHDFWGVTSGCTVSMHGAPFAAEAQNKAAEHL
jgi:hypothetical protein